MNHSVLYTVSYTTMILPSQVLSLLQMPDQICSYTSSCLRSSYNIAVLQNTAFVTKRTAASLHCCSEDHPQAMPLRRSAPCCAPPCHWRSSHRAAKTFQEEIGNLAPVSVKSVATANLQLFSCCYLSIQCRVSVGLPKFYNIYRRAKLKNLT